MVSERVFFTVYQKRVWFFSVGNTQIGCFFRGAGRTCLPKKSLSARTTLTPLPNPQIQKQ